MKRVTKIITGILCSVVLIGGDVTAVQASTEKICIQNQSSIENSDIIQEFYDNKEKVYVTDEACLDVTEQFWDETKYMYLEGDIETIKNYIVNNDLTLHLITNSNKIELQALAQYKSVTSEMIYFMLWDTNRATNIEVTAELKGGIWYDVATDEVVKVSNTTYNILTMRVGSPGISLYANDFQTGSSVINGKGYFWGKCHFYGEDPDNMYGYAYDYGSKLASFYATP